MTMRAFWVAFLGRTNSLGGFEALAGSDFCVHSEGSGVVSVGVAFAGFERVRAIVATVSGILVNQVNQDMGCCTVYLSVCLSISGTGRG